MTPLIAHHARDLAGRVAVPGDKSISHRALIIGALTVGETTVTGLLEGEDVLATADAARALGAEVARDGAGVWRVHGRGVGGLAEPETVVDCGNSGTGARLLMGAAAGQPIAVTFTGDASLRGRPMSRVLEPLARMGVATLGRAGGRLPLTLKGPARLQPIEYRLPVASAQVKSALLLAGLAAPGETVVIEPEPTRDHTERMLRAFGARLAIEDGAHGRRVALSGEPELRPSAIAVPGDPSSAAFPVVAGLIAPGSEIAVEGVLANPLRAGLYETLREMGGDLAFENAREAGGEPVVDMKVRASGLMGVEVPPERAPSMIDEYPILAVAAAFAEGTTTMRGLKELRVKESDRLAAVARGLEACGVALEEGEDWLAVHGRGPGGVAGGGAVATHMDHRIAMAFLVLGTAAKQPVTIDDGAMIATSFPGFTDLMGRLGARIEAAG